MLRAAWKTSCSLSGQPSSSFISPKKELTATKTMNIYTDMEVGQKFNKSLRWVTKTQLFLHDVIHPDEGDRSRRHVRFFGPTGRFWKYSLLPPFALLPGCKTRFVRSEGAWWGFCWLLAAALHYWGFPNAGWYTYERSKYHYLIALHTGFGLGAQCNVIVLRRLAPQKITSWQYSALNPMKSLKITPPSHSATPYMLHTNGSRIGSCAGLCWTRILRSTVRELCAGPCTCPHSVGCSWCKCKRSIPSSSVIWLTFTSHQTFCSPALPHLLESAAAPATVVWKASLEVQKDGQLEFSKLHQ